MGRSTNTRCDCREKEPFIDKFLTTNHYVRLELTMLRCAIKGIDTNSKNQHTLYRFFNSTTVFLIQFETFYSKLVLNKQALLYNVWKFTILLTYQTSQLLFAFIFIYIIISILYCPLSFGLNIILCKGCWGPWSGVQNRRA